ncbi:MAG: sterol desaturase family protein [Gemmatimonadetes bacterium]|nr:sterol desaturase family protein [Gemmatimonadota bacterium]
MDVVQASIPLFFILIGLELVVARLSHRRLYRLNDSISDLSLGTVSQLVGIFLAIGTIYLYDLVQRYGSVQALIGAPAWIDRTPFPATGSGLGFGLDAVALVSWSVVFLLDDLAYYWLHRLSHEVNLLWAGHVVHHSSEEYNLTVALRQSSLHGLMSWVFYLPLALLGVPVTMWVVCHGLNLIYQFWIHTRAIDRLPRALEAVLNTPSHHRVHHGVNPRYQDRNYAGVFIIWDRLFGTFEPEVEPPVYGITKPLASWNPIWANLHVFVDLFRTARRTPGWRDKLRVVFGRPGWKPAALGPSETPRPVTPETYRKFDPPLARPLRLYAAVQFLAALVASVALLAAVPALPWSQILAGVFYLVLTLSNVATVLESRSWAAVSEVVRLVVLAAVAGILLAQGRGPAAPLIGAALFAVGSAAWIVLLRPLFGPPPAQPAAT